MIGHNEAIEGMKKKNNSEKFNKLIDFGMQMQMAITIKFGNNSDKKALHQKAPEIRSKREKSMNKKSYRSKCGVFFLLALLRLTIASVQQPNQSLYLCGSFTLLL